MQIDTGSENLTGKKAEDTMDDSQESTLNWLLDMDMSEPEERLFALDHEEQPDTELSDYELEVARRPMTRGSPGADNLENYVGEEIVISSDSSGGDIYAKGSENYSQNQTDSASNQGEQMAVDYSRTPRSSVEGVDQTVSDGADILGLADDDDIGEKFLVLRRVKHTAPGKGQAQPGNTVAQAGDSTTSPEQPEATGTATPGLVLNEAPSLRLVSPVEPLSVANDVSPAGDERAAVAGLDSGVEMLLDQRPLESDQADEASDSNELSLLPLDSEHYFDATPAQPIDYHEDFEELEGFSGDAATNITPLVPQLMEELLAAVTERLVTLQGDPDSVQAQLMLGADPAAATQLLADGYELAISVCNPPLASLRQLRQVDVEAIYIRLSYMPTGEVCNRMFDEDFTLPAAVVQEGVQEQLQDSLEEPEGLDTLVAQSRALRKPETASEPEAETALEQQPGEVFETGFGAELGADPGVGSAAEFGADPGADPGVGPGAQLGADPGADPGAGPGAELGAELGAEPGADLERERGADIGAPPGSDLETEFGAEHSAGLGDIADLDLEAPAPESLEGVTARQWQPDDQDIDNVFADFNESESDPATTELGSTDAPGELCDGQQADGFDVFAEDLFAPEQAADLQPADDTPQADIDALFDSLGLAQDENEENIEPELDELVASSAPVQLVAEADESVAVDELSLAETTGNWCIPDGITFAQATLGGGEVFADFLDAFVEEGSSELEKLEDAIAAWERDVASEEAFTVVGRVLHTVKGIAKGVGLQFYGTLVHNFETLLGAVARPQVGAEGNYFRIVNAWLDACVRGLDHIQDTRADIANVLPQVAGQAAADAGACQGEGAQPELAAQEVQDQQEPAAAKVAPLVPSAAAPSAAEAREKQLSKKIADDGARVLAAQQSVRITSEKLDDLLNMSNQAQQLSVRTAQSVTRGKRASTEMQSRLASVRAHIAGIADRALRSVAAGGGQPGGPMDALEMDQYSELQEAANILREGVEDLADLVDFATRQNTQIEALLKQQTNVISSIGSAIRSARVVPVSRLIPGLRRLVRTVSVDLNKAVSFHVLNELGTLDRDDYARCQTILDHMMRNALDHGIEAAEERVAAGKPAEGQVTIDIRKAGADTIITLSDDGRGIDPDQMRESATRKKLELDVDALTDEEAIRLIFHKGFSTASAVSQISGRGVGMDIVLSELQEMGGDIGIDSVTGRGTSFHIRVPSTVTVNGALLVSAGEQSYAIPLGGLIAVEQVPVDAFFSAVRDNTRLQLAGMECEPAYLATLCRNGHALDAKTWRNNVPVIIAGSPERYMAIAIDDVEEALELVIRSLGTQFSSVPGVAGAATTAAGEAIVALDLNLLVASVGLDGQSAQPVETGREEAPLVMVVDDSRTQRMVATSQLEALGVETITAENGAVAIELLNTADRLPDIILMDVEMPVKDGIQALRDIRKSVRFGEVPVIMITSRTGLKHRAMAQAAGCNGYMGKPFNFRMLVGQINELTGHKLQPS